MKWVIRSVIIIRYFSHVILKTVKTTNMFCCRAHFSSGRRLGRTMITRKVIFYKATFGHVALKTVGTLRWCYTRPFATTIFSSTKRCNIVATDIFSSGYNIVPTLQRCVALKIFVANPPE